MPRVGRIPDLNLAACVMRVAESRSLEALGAACGRAIGQFTGRSTFGLYWVHAGAPKLFASAGIPDGFDDDYRSGLGRNDPFIDSILRHGRVVDGLSLIGAQHWARSTTRDLLRSWGLSYNMCGPLRLEDRVAGVFYTARPEGVPYTSAHREGMELLCRAGSLALTRMATAAEENGARAEASLHDELPPRAAAVARLICRGRSNKEIARDMAISDETVKDHVASLCRRFGALNRTELAARLQSRAPRS